MHYRPDPLPVHLDVVCSEERLASDENLFAGWPAIAECGISTHTVRGDHHSILTPPNVSDVAELTSNIYRNSL